MPGFNTLTGKTAWSDRHNYTSGRVTTGTTERPAAEYRLRIDRSKFAPGRG